MVNPSLAVNPSLRPSMPYRTPQDIAGITQIASLQPALVAGPDGPFNTLAELIAYARKSPGKLTYGTPGASVDEASAACESDSAAFGSARSLSTCFSSSMPWARVSVTFCRSSATSWTLLSTLLPWPVPWVRKASSRLRKS